MALSGQILASISFNDKVTGTTFLENLNRNIPWGNQGGIAVDGPPSRRRSSDL